MSGRPGARAGAAERERKVARLQARLRACRRCLEAGHWVAPGPVVHGAATAQVMTIGQAPGITEAQVKRPFNAGSGRRLFQWLGAAGFDEAEFRAGQYMVAVTRCYPGKAAGGHGDRVPTPAEQALCRPWLEAELALIDPRLIIPIGRLAIGLFYEPPWQLEDVIGTQREVDGRVIIPLPHPSGASTWPNKPANAARIQAAIKKIARQRRTLGL